MTSEVGSGQLAIVPVFKGFRKAVAAETDGVTTTSSRSMTAGFTKAGSTSGKGFASSFNSSTSSIGAASLKALSTEVAKSSREVAALRLKELDATGKVRLAEAQLAEARRKYSSDSSQVVRAEERLASAQRGHISTQSSLVNSTEKLAGAQKSLTAATDAANAAGSRQGGVFGTLRDSFGLAGGRAATSFGNSFTSGIGQIFTGSFLANAATGIVRDVGAFTSDVISAGVSYGLESVSLASDAEQSVGAIAAVFKENAGEITTYSKTSAKDVGLSKRAFQQYSTVVGAQLKNLGIPMGKVAGQTNDLITLGADLAAQFGGDTSQAVGALSSLLRGERDPIERYGVSIKQTDIDARKAALGLSGLTGEADKQAEITATLGILWEQTADAQGTFFRETDTYAHKTQVLSAELENAKVQLGEQLLPAFTTAAQYANDELIPALQNVIDRVGPKLGQALSDTAPLWGELKSEIGPVLDQMVDMGIEALPDMITGLKDIVKQGPAAIRFFEDLADAGDKTADGLNKIVEVENGIPEFFQGLGLDREANGLFDDLLPWDKFLENLEDRNEAVHNEATRIGLTTTEGLTSGIQQGAGATQEAARLMAQGAVDAAAGPLGSTNPTGGYYIGSMFVEGVKQGVNAKYPELMNAVTNLGVGMGVKLKEATDSHSPSRVGEEIGGWFPEGVAIGVKKKTSLAVDAVSAMGSGMAAAVGAPVYAPGSGGAGSVSAAPVVVEQTYWMTDQDPRLFGRQLGREFADTIAGLQG